MVNNARFLILPWVQVRNLASTVLAHVAGCAAPGYTTRSYGTACSMRCRSWRAAPANVWPRRRRRWCCTECQSGYEGEALADLAREHVRDGVRAGRARRNRASHGRQVVRGAPGAAAVLLRLSRATLLAGVTGAERRALAWALRDVGDAPLSRHAQGPPAAYPPSPGGASEATATGGPELAARSGNGQRF